MELTNAIFDQIKNCLRKIFVIFVYLKINSVAIVIEHNGDIRVLDFGIKT